MTEKFKEGAGPQKIFFATKLLGFLIRYDTKGKKEMGLYFICNVENCEITDI